MKVLSILVFMTILLTTNSWSLKRVGKSVEKVGKKVYEEVNKALSNEDEH